ncbi:50S ribosomal protein L25 [Candidatus Falkowbacteria bacterium]|nr:50S ribosomal protein L25 [Candidatus Falkowbacteria bacterium]NCT55151.1 50S ribosomal protein L25 [Candidatus Falkowbacteria bacterium]
MDFKIKAEKREKKEKLSKDFIPAVLYGKEVETQSLKIRKAEFEKIFASAGESNLIELNLDGAMVKVLVKDIQRNVLNHSLTHADLYQVNMKEKVVAEIPLNFIGESKAVKELGAMLNKDLDNLEVECLPGYLVDHIDVDISVLTSFDDAIRIGDLKLPAGVVATGEAEEMVASVKELKIVEEEVPVVAVEEKAADGKALADATVEPKV